MLSVAMISQKGGAGKPTAPLVWPPKPTSGRHDAQHWPDLLDVLYRARDWTVPDADGGRWFSMALRRLPTGADHEMPALET